MHIHASVDHLIDAIITLVPRSILSAQRGGCGGSGDDCPGRVGHQDGENDSSESGDSQDGRQGVGVGVPTTTTAPGVLQPSSGNRPTKAVISSTGLQYVVLHSPYGGTGRV